MRKAEEARVVCGSRGGSQNVWRQCNRGRLGVRARRGAAMEQSRQSAAAAHAADVGQLLYGSGTSVGRSVCGAHPEGGAGRRMCFALLSSSTTQARLDWS